MKFSSSSFIRKAPAIKPGDKVHSTVQVVTIEPFTRLPGFWILAMLLSFRKRQTALNNAGSLVYVWSVESLDAVSFHNRKGD